MFGLVCCFVDFASPFTGVVAKLRLIQMLVLWQRRYCAVFGAEIARQL